MINNNYSISDPIHDVPRFPGDPIQSGTQWIISYKGREIGKIFYNGAYPGKCHHSLNALRWSGNRPDGFHDPDWHDSQPYESFTECYLDLKRRAAVILKYHADHPRDPNEGRIQARAT